MINFENTKRLIDRLALSPLVIGHGDEDHVWRVYQNALTALPELRALLAERDALKEQEQKLNAQLTEQKAEIKLLEEFFTHSPHCNYWDSDFDEDGELVEGGTEYVCNCQWDTNAEQISILRNELKSILSAEANGERR